MSITRLSGTGLTCIRGGREVFAGLDFEVTAGEALAVTGHNGAGKSSLLRLIAGLLPAAQGRIAIEGNPATDLSLAEQIHYLGHRDALKPTLTVQENLAFWLDFLGGERNTLDASLATAGLAHIARLPAATLSAGQRRRLSMARLIAVKRPVWLLDEPTSALDADGQALIARLMSGHLTQGGLVIAATHGPLGITAREQRIGRAA
ncbi:heme ABC exporter ATP-binding protein CcmA [Bradyrhizobium sp. 2TAF24]|uniref:heme ABC exporter ATP-binding protein CcmA n=1 Tax=Bradyrhizobium sp. 2TAF24 TaxID=3233011 RepID=UPI003F93BC6F